MPVDLATTLKDSLALKERIEQAIEENKHAASKTRSDLKDTYRMLRSLNCRPTSHPGLSSND